MVEKKYKYNVYNTRSCELRGGSCLALHSVHWKLLNTE